MPAGKYVRTDKNGSRNKIDPKMASAKNCYSRNYGYYKDGDVSFEIFCELSQRPCHYCGSPPSTVYNLYKFRKDVRQWTKDNADWVYNGLDRIDSSQPHNLANVVPCCKFCNYMKHTSSYQDFLNRVIAIFNNMKLHTDGYTV